VVTESTETKPRERDRLSWQVLAALVVVVLAIGAAVALGLINKANPVVATGPVPVTPVGQPGADSAACTALMSALPVDLSGAHRRATNGGGPGIAAWGDPVIIMRCGLETPAQLDCSAAFTQINGVSWLELPAEGLPETTYIASDRSVRIALTLSNTYGVGPIQQLSDIISATLKVRPPCSKGLLLPTDLT